MGLAQSVRKLSAVEYLEAERAADTRHEFFDGEMFAMAGGSPSHSLICANAISAFNTRLTGKGCVVFESNLRLQVEATGLFTYPDVSIVCGPRKFVEGTNDTLINPKLLIEALSDSTEAYDRGLKFEHYRRIPTLTEYILLSQKKPQVEVFSRDGAAWRLEETGGLDGVLQVASLSLAIPLTELYANVDFSSGN